jgi:hypothetical protein
MAAADYAAAAEEIDARLRELPGIVAIYALGSVTAPGISDLDRIAVVDGGAALRPFWPELTERTRYVAMHTPFAVDADTFRRHRWFAYLEPLEAVWGEPIAPEAPPLEEHANLLLAAESLTLNLLRVVKAVRTGRVKVRSALCELHSVRHGLSLAGLCQENAPRAFALAGEVAELRREWFEAPEEARERRIGELVATAEPALREALAALGGAPRPAEPLKLAAAWSAVTLRPSQEAGAPEPAAPSRFGFLLARSPRLAEARWRAGSHDVEIREQVLALLRGDVEPDFHARRTEVARRYARFAETQAPGFSTIGLAAAFGA